jgi:cell volume regulation protein A
LDAACREVWSAIIQSTVGGTCMEDVEVFGLLVAAISIAASLAILSNRFSERTRIPAPALFLVAAAVASELFPSLNALSFESVQRIVTVALAVILFDGGMHIGARRFREASAPVVVLGVVGTALTAAALGLIGHVVFGLDWKPAFLLATALAATDPAVVFSILGKREIAGRAGTILEGESGANDPVGIALMVVLLTATGSGAGAVFGGLGLFVLQMALGLGFGLLGGWLMLLMMRRVPLPSAGLYSVRTLAAARALYGVATIAHGSGFLAVFVAGILIGDERAPYKAEIERFHGALASLGEIVAFTILGLTIDLSDLTERDIWTGLGLGALLMFLVRPLLVGMLVLPMRLTPGERTFIVWAGLKGAVPILLGTFAITAGAPDAARIYHTIFVVVALSVIVQGGLVPAVAHRLGVPMRTIEPEPWSVGVRLRHEPEGMRRIVVAERSATDGAAIRDLDLGEDVWISIVTRKGRLVPLERDAVLQAGDEVLMFGEPEATRLAEALFTAS